MLEKMKTFESTNYIFHYLKDSTAENEIDKIAEKQESCFREICSTLSIKPEFKINYYLVDTPEEIGILYGDNEPCNGFAREPDEIYAVYNDKVKCIGYHEDAHIISYLISMPQSTFIREGLAMYFDKTWWKRPNEEWVKQYIEDNKYVSIYNLINDKEFGEIPCEISYPIAGTFTKFLVSSIGIKRYLELYKKGIEKTDEIEKCLKCNDLDDKFKEFL